MLSIEMIDTQKFRVITRYGEQVLMHEYMTLEQLSVWLSSLSEDFVRWNKEESETKSKQEIEKMVALPA
jgi:hypothetical protein